MDFEAEKKSGWEKLEKLIADADQNYYARVGILGGKRYAPKNKEEKGELVAKVAAINEFGAPKKNIPPRPTVRPAIKKNKKKYLQIFENMLAGLGETTTMPEILETVAISAVADIQAEIAKIQSPALRPSTIKARARERVTAHHLIPLIDDKTTKENLPEIGGLTKPLINQAILLNSYTYDIKKIGES